MEWLAAGTLASEAAGAQWSIYIYIYIKGGGGGEVACLVLSPTCHLPPLPP